MQKHLDEILPCDGAYIGHSPMTTLISAFLEHGLKPDFQLSPSIKSREVQLPRTKVRDHICDMRDLIYCFYDVNYFENVEEGDKTLT